MRSRVKGVETTTTRRGIGGIPMMAYFAIRTLSEQEGGLGLPVWPLVVIAVAVLIVGFVISERVK